MKVLALHSSRFGHTAAIMHRIAQRLREGGCEVEVRPVDALRSIDADIDAVVIGASVRYGFFAPAVRRFTKRNAARLNVMPTAFLGVNLAAAKPEKSTPQTNPYVRKFLAKTPWKPRKVWLCGGELDFRLYNGLDTAMLKPILKASGKPWGPDVHIDYTDWEAVDRYAAEFTQLLHGAG